MLSLQKAGLYCQPNMSSNMVKILNWYFLIWCLLWSKGNEVKFIFELSVKEGIT